MENYINHHFALLCFRHFLGFYTVVAAILLLSLTGTLGLLRVILDPNIDINHLLGRLYGEPTTYYNFF